MKIAWRIVPMLAGILLTLFSGVSRATGDETAIRVFGSAELAALIQVVEKEFTAEHPNVRIQVLARTSEFGFLALLSKQADLVMSARKPNAVERRLAERKHVQWAGVRVAWENVAVICHPGVSVRELTVDQLRKIYTGEYVNWRDVGGADLPIRVHSINYPKNDIALWFSSVVLAGADFRSGIIWVKTPSFLVEHVSIHAGAIAYLGNFELNVVRKHQPRSDVKVLSIRAKAGSPAVAPSLDMFHKGVYPLTVPLFLFWNKNIPDKRFEQFALFCKEKLPTAVDQLLK
jgi:phosphate transport system substrate-binding protein